MITPSIFTHLQDVHVAAWNEKNAEKRFTLLEQIYAKGIVMYDAENVFDGLAAVSEFIGKLLKSDPQFQFNVVKPIEPLQNGARLFGTIQTTDVLLNSMDFFLLDTDNKVYALYAFLEPSAG